LVTLLAGDATSVVPLPAAVCVSVACPLTPPVWSDAVIVAWPGAVELVMVAEYVPLPLLVVVLTCCPESLEENTTVSVGTTSPLTSTTVAVAMLLEVPLARIVLGESLTTTLVACPYLVRSAVALTFAVVSVAVMVDWPGP
jgi:hypothetical protein